MTDVLIYHHPSCSNSRGALALIRAAGIEPRIVEYQKTPLDRARLTELLKMMGMGARELLRAKEALAAELGLDRPGTSESQIVAAMVEHPKLINRPIVVTAKGARLCRPPEKVLELLPKK